MCTVLYCTAATGSQPNCSWQIYHTKSKALAQKACWYPCKCRNLQQDHIKMTTISFHIFPNPKKVSPMTKHHTTKLNRGSTAPVLPLAVRKRCDQLHYISEKDIPANTRQTSGCFKQQVWTWWKQNYILSLLEIKASSPTWYSTRLLHYSGSSESRL
jgi:hypothetical protein